MLSSHYPTLHRTRYFFRIWHTTVTLHCVTLHYIPRGFLPFLSLVIGCCLGNVDSRVVSWFIGFRSFSFSLCLFVCLSFFVSLSLSHSFFLIPFLSGWYLIVFACTCIPLRFPSLHQGPLELDLYLYLELDLGTWNLNLECGTWNLSKPSSLCHNASARFVFLVLYRILSIVCAELRTLYCLLSFSLSTVYCLLHCLSSTVLVWPVRSHVSFLLHLRKLHSTPPRASFLATWVGASTKIKNQKSKIKKKEILQGG